MESSGDRYKLEAIARSLRSHWNNEKSVIGVLNFLVEELDSRDDPGALAFGVVVCMHEAFDMSMGDAKRISGWNAIGGILSDDEIEKRLSPLIPRVPES